LNNNCCALKHKMDEGRQLVDPAIVIENRYREMSMAVWVVIVRYDTASRLLPVSKG